MNGVREADLAGRLIGSGSAHAAPDGNRRRIFEIEPAEDSNRIHGMKDGRLSRVGQGRGQIEAFDARMKVRGIQADDFGVLGGGFRKQVLVGREHVAEPHPGAIGVAAGPHDVAFDKNGVLVIGRNRVDSNSIAIADFKGLESLGHFRGVFDFRDIHAQHRLLVVGHHALHFDVPERRGGKKAAGKLEHAGQRVLLPQFVDRRTANHSLYRHFRTDRRDLHGVSIFQPLQVRLHSMQEEVIQIHGFDELRAAIMLQNPHGPPRRRSARGEQRIERRGKRADVVRAGIRDIADFINTNRA